MSYLVVALVSFVAGFGVAFHVYGVIAGRAIKTVWEVMKTDG